MLTVTTVLNRTIRTERGVLCDCSHVAVLRGHRDQRYQGLGGELFAGHVLQEWRCRVVDA